MCLNSTTENQTQDNIPDIAPQISHRSKFFTTDAEDNQTMHVKVEIQDGDFGNNENTSHSSVLENFQVRNHDDGTSQNVFSENHGVDKRYTGKTLQNVNKSQAQYIKTEIVDESLSPPQVGVVMENLEDGSYQYPGIISHNLTQHIKEEFPDEETMEVENHNERDYIVSNSEEMDMMNVQDAGGEITHSDRNYAQNDDETLKMEIHDDRTDTDNDETDMDNVRWQPGDKVQVVRVSKDVFPAGQSPSTDASSSKPCQICGGISDGVHFGVTSCIPCKTVFATTGIYKCAGEKRCDLTRNGCKYCLIEKCVAVGMSMHASDKKDSKKRTETLFLPGTRSHPSRSSFPGQQKVSVHVSRGDATQPPTKRFRSVTEEELMRNETSPQSKSTYRNTQWGLRIFQDWLSEKRLSADFENEPVEEIASKLRQFYAEVVNKKGERYSKSALIGARSAINRHLNSPPFSRNINIMKDPNFISANTVLLGIIEMMKEDGCDTAKHKEAISKNDLHKLYAKGVLANDSPTQLLRKVWFEIALHFGRRGREGLRSLKHDAFVLKSDDEGRKYFTMSFNEKDKTHSGVDSRETLKVNRMYETCDEFCPVVSLTKYMLKRNPEDEAFFQRPLTNFQDKDVWYGAQPLGINTLLNMMSIISKAAGLSQVYTNHCVRATTATMLAHAGVDSRGIMSVTGHRNQKSLQSYINTPSIEQRHQYSCVLQSSATGNSLNQVALQNTSTAPAPIPTAMSNSASNFLYAQSDTTTNSSSLTAGFPMFSVATISVAQDGNFTVNMNVNK
ncbi:uncharacterized protein LOC117315013 isoform X1 [Pecten maximus]|uniref:uncharacterized protein LOC117315013 isoform X1 n=1 Tax=Pecten maximus TaxID=6579 RepID=UPI0014585456|nr:uncharacterized protein LOC117315013 isoform X1 [Pecten maximus]